MRCNNPECLVDFEATVHNKRYCSPRCKREVENTLRRKFFQPIVMDAPGKKWEQEEQQKLDRADETRKKNEYLLDNKSFAMVDIESSQLDADFGRLICVGIKPLHEEPIMLSTRGDDRKLAEKVARELRNYDYIVTYFGTRFDIPFLTTRLLVHGLEPLGLTRHVDVYYTVRSILKLASNRQALAVQSLFGKADRTDVVASVWARATEGDKEAIQYVVDHCYADLFDLERLFLKMVKFRNIAATPLRRY